MEKNAHPQLILDLGTVPRLDRERFHVSPANAAALALVEMWPRWPGFALLICGPAGAGKSHLARIWAQMAQALVVAAPDIGGVSLAGLGPGKAVVVEQADAIGRGEADLFHLFNLLRESNGWLMLTACAGPDHWGLSTPDLLSRLRLAPMALISAPDDALVRQVLAKNLADRQVRVDPGVIDYILVRMERSFEAARLLAVQLDAAALARGTAITRAIAAEVLGQIYGGDDLFELG